VSSYSSNQIVKLPACRQTNSNNSSKILIRSGGVIAENASRSTEFVQYFWQGQWINRKTSQLDSISKCFKI